MGLVKKNVVKVNILYVNTIDCAIHRFIVQFIDMCYFKKEMGNLLDNKLSSGHFVLFKDPEHVNPCIQVGQGQFFS